MLVIIITVFCISVAVFISLIVLDNRRIRRELHHVETMIATNTLPAISLIEQTKFILGKDQGTIARKLGVGCIDRRFFEAVFTITRDELSRTLLTDEMRQLLNYNEDVEDGLWIANFGETFELVEQKKGRDVEHRIFRSKDEMADVLIDFYALRFPKFRSGAAITQE